VVDPGEGTIEVWALGPGFTGSTVHADALRWTPVTGGPTLDIDLAELFG
jgi:hypothetical protein